MHNFQNLGQREKLLVGAVLVLILGLGLFLFFGNVTPASGSTCDAMYEEWTTEHAADATEKEVYAGEIAEVDFESARHPQIEQLKNGISTAVKEGANFAGHYAVVEWSCGEYCQEHAVVDVKSGKIVTFDIPSEEGLQFTPEKNTIITNPDSRFPTLADLKSLTLDDKIYWYNLPREYYVLEENGDSASVRRICIQNAFEGKM